MKLIECMVPGERSVFKRYFRGDFLWLGATTALCHVVMNCSLLVSSSCSRLFYASFSIFCLLL